MKDLEDGKLVELSLARYSGAFDILVERYYKVVYSSVFKMVGNAEVASDLLQDIFIKVYQNLRQYKRQYKFFSWVYRIAMNEAINYCHRHHQNTDEIFESFASEATPESLYCKSELDSRVQQALMKLKPEHRSLIILSHFQGFSYHEIAEVVSIPEKTIKSRLFSSRQELRNIFIKDGILNE